jgi:hypothetical protein
LAKRDGQPLGTYARHYYDLFQLASTPEVVAMLKSDEYGRIKADYDAISRKHFARGYIHLAGMSFAASDALFPTSRLGDAIAAEYERQCRALCYGAFPAWSDVQTRFGELRPLL